MSQELHGTLKPRYHPGARADDLAELCELQDREKMDSFEVKKYGDNRGL